MLLYLFCYIILRSVTGSMILCVGCLFGINQFLFNQFYTPFVVYFVRILYNQVRHE